METTDQLIQKGAEGFTSTLLLLYTDAISDDIDDERMRWRFAYIHGPTLPVPLSNDDLLALQQIIDKNEIWQNKTKTNPINIVEMVVMQKASNVVGGYMFQEHIEIIKQGVIDGINMFRVMMPNRSALLD